MGLYNNATDSFEDWELTRLLDLLETDEDKLRYRGPLNYLIRGVNGLNIRRLVNPPIVTVSDLVAYLEQCQQHGEVMIRGIGPKRYLLLREFFGNLGIELPDFQVEEVTTYRWKRG